ncbi:MAG: 5'-nucleotidase C-terminal domain-containing protein, partial [Myxococcota bacterium]
MKSTMRLGLVPVLATLMVGCPDNDDDKEETGVPVDTGMVEPETGDTDTGEPPVMAAFTLQLLHFADVDGNEATALSNVPDFSALVDGFSNDETYGGASILVSSGDNLIPGPRWFAAENSDVRSISGSNEPGNADHYIMNQLGVVASVIGNHDLDQGPGEFADAIQAESGGGADFPGTLFPYLAANIDFSQESDLTVGDAGADVSTLGAQVAASATVVVDGETIGLVGVSTPQLPSITTTGALVIDGSLDPISELADAVQPAIDALADSGIDKIVVLAHLQNLNNEKALAGELENVDIIVAGGSNTRMGDSNDSLYPGDDAFAETYPFQTTNGDGDPLLIVNVDGDYKYLGRLVVGFDEDGVVMPELLDDTVSGVYAADAGDVATSGGTANADAVAMRDALDGVIETQYDNVIGHTDVYLEGRRNNVRTEETNLGNLTADANKWYAQGCDGITNVISLKNGGGIRAEIGEVSVEGDVTTLTPPANFGLPTAVEGDVSEGHFRGTLRFDNGLVVLDMTPTCGNSPSVMPGAAVATPCSRRVLSSMPVMSSTTSPLS